MTASYDRVKGELEVNHMTQTARIYVEWRAAPAVPAPLFVLSVPFFIIHTVRALCTRLWCGVRGGTRVTPHVKPPEGSRKAPIASLVEASELASQLPSEVEMNEIVEKTLEQVAEAEAESDPQKSVGRIWAGQANLRKKIDQGFKELREEIQNKAAGLTRAP